MKHLKSILLGLSICAGFGMTTSASAQACNSTVPSSIEFVGVSQGTPLVKYVNGIQTSDAATGGTHGHVLNCTPNAIPNGTQWTSFQFRTENYFTRAWGIRGWSLGDHVPILMRAKFDTAQGHRFRGPIMHAVYGVVGEVSSIRAEDYWHGTGACQNIFQPPSTPCAPELFPYDGPFVLQDFVTYNVVAHATVSGVAYWVTNTSTGATTSAYFQEARTSGTVDGVWKSFEGNRVFNSTGFGVAVLCANTPASRCDSRGPFRVMLTNIHVGWF